MVAVLSEPDPEFLNNPTLGELLIASIPSPKQDRPKIPIPEFAVPTTAVGFGTTGPGYIPSVVAFIPMGVHGLQARLCTFRAPIAKTFEHSAPTPGTLPQITAPVLLPLLQIMQLTLAVTLDGPLKRAIPPLKLQHGVSVVTAVLSEFAEDSGSTDLIAEVPPRPTAAEARAAFLMKFLLFADSIVDSGQTVFESVMFRFHSLDHSFR
jgi:hypothetical protein